VANSVVINDNIKNMLFLLKEESVEELELLRRLKQGQQRMDQVKTKQFLLKMAFVQIPLFKCLCSNDFCPNAF
jgi:hypothetical protein